jgi:hypothetical protein
MFIHFDSEPAAICDNCGRRHTIMYLQTEHSERSVSFCINCFQALFRALSHASAKVRM